MSAGGSARSRWPSSAAAQAAKRGSAAIGRGREGVAVLRLFRIAEQAHAQFRLFERGLALAIQADSAFVGASFEGARLSTIDGLRADWDDGWGLVRASNTTPILVLRFEADNTAALERIKDEFRARLQALAPELTMTF